MAADKAWLGGADAGHARLIRPRTLAVGQEGCFVGIAAPRDGQDAVLAIAAAGHPAASQAVAVHAALALGARPAYHAQKPKPPLTKVTVQYDKQADALDRADPENDGIALH